MLKLLFGGCSSQNFISFLDKFPNRASPTMDLIRAKLPSRVSSTMDIMSVQQQIPGNDSVCSPTATLLNPDLTLVSPPSGRHFLVLRDLEEDMLFPSPAE